MADRKTEPTEKPPPHPLTVCRESRLFRYVTHEDVRRWEIIEMKYHDLIDRLRMAISNE